MRNTAEEIFADALEMDSSRRAEFLASACEGDSDLLAEVQAMLRDAESAETFFESMTRGAAGNPAFEPVPSSDRPGTQIGAYRLIRILGRGGFGSVWLAEQSRPIRRSVALKLIKRGMDSDEVLTRFRAEQQAVALMDHPNITRVYEAGSSPDGRPFFVMELVDGKKITEFCDANHFTITERLQLFLQVCAAVNHAHQKGIIHRDLKPSNILITTDGVAPVAKVIDFGIAKAVGSGQTEYTEVTKLDQVIGTPAYMSPEQATGNRADVDTRSDVYSLGIILYEVLVGRVPFDLKDPSLQDRDVRNVIRDLEAVRPSVRLQGLPTEEQNAIASVRRTTSEALHGQVRAELDWIVMKAIDKVKDRRYETADALAKDIGRFLQNEPVSAKPPSTTYLLGKLVARHRTLIITLAVIMATLLVATVVSLWLAFRANQAEHLADARLNQVLDEKAGRDKALGEARAVSTFIIDVFRRPHPDRDGRDVTAAEVLARAEKDLQLKLFDQPEQQLLLKRTLAETYTGLGLYQDAIRLDREVLHAGRAFFGEGSPETFDDYSRLSDLLLRLGYYDEALGLLEREVALRKSAPNPDPQKIEAANLALIECLHRTGQHERADQINKQRNAPSPEPTPAPYSTSSSLGAEGEALRKIRVSKIQSDLDQAKQTRDPLDADLLRAIGDAAQRMFSLAEWPTAVALQRDLTGRLNQKYGPDHMFTIEAEDYLAYLLMKTGSYEESSTLRRSLLDRRQRIFGPEHLETLIAQENYAQIRFFAGHLEEATNDLERIVPLLRKVAGPDNRATLNAESDLARCYSAGDRTPEAIDLLLKCAPKMRDDSFISSILGKLLLWSGRMDEFRAFRRDSLDWAWQRRERIGTRADIWERIMAFSCLAPLDDENQAAQVKEMIRLCVQQRGLRASATNSEIGWSTASEGLIYYRIGDYSSARAKLETSRKVLQDKPKHYQRQTAEIFLALTLAAQESPSAGKLYRDIRKTIPEPPSMAHPLHGCFAVEGEALTPWIARREGDTVFKQP